MVRPRPGDPAALPGTGRSTAASPARRPSTASRSRAGTCSRSPSRERNRRPRARWRWSPPTRRPRACLRGGRGMSGGSRRGVWLAVPVIAPPPLARPLPEPLRAGRLAGEPRASPRSRSLPPLPRQQLRAGGALEQRLDLRGERRALGADRRAARLPLHAATTSPAGGCSAPWRPSPCSCRRWSASSPSSSSGERAASSRAASSSSSGSRGPVAAHRRLGDPAGARVHHVRLLLPLRERGPLAARRGLRGGGRGAGRLAAHHAAPRHPPDAHPRRSPARRCWSS